MEQVTKQLKLVNVLKTSSSTRHLVERALPSIRRMPMTCQSHGGAQVVEFRPSVGRRLTRVRSNHAQNYVRCLYDGLRRTVSKRLSSPVPWRSRGP